MKGYWHHPGCRLNLTFSIYSAGEVTFMVKSIVQCTDELDHKIDFKLGGGGAPYCIVCSVTSTF